MIKRKPNKIPFNFVFLMLFSALLIITYCYWENDIPYFQRDPFINVKKYSPEIHNELGKYHLEKYTPVIIALMQQESKGKGGDPMQSSESIGLPPNSIKDPKESIQIGVKHFRHILTYGQEKQVDFATIIQAYNMGIGYINYVAAHGGKHNEKLAKEFSLLQVKKHPSIYNCKKSFFNSRYPYCYGDYAYSEKVNKNITSLNEGYN
ncbi:lysozyme family protein [Bacillus sp. BRMEA1]|uniref:lysozyme family protein n=1 Tax=Neobacillus endophyticus TaxID=2738405 RepID=UPI001563ADB7|nr:lysozyme family protein [Neobacillus endophyticus]NRD78966.1 lysozyme family protein [Neobacillus endophyticus]